MRAWLVLSLIAACSRASDESGAKQWPKPPAGAGVEIPAELSIEVSIDGAPGTAITGAQLRAAKPDFADAERSAWMLTKLVPAAAPPGSSLEAVGPAGISVTFPRPIPNNLEPVLFLTRRGDVNVEAVDPADPFPRFHGNGGRLHRVGDSIPHVEKVTRIAITHGHG
jgi:hypothetical protein